MGYGTTGGCPSSPVKGHLTRFEPSSWMEDTESLVHPNTSISYSHIPFLEAVPSSFDMIDQFSHSSDSDGHPGHLQKSPQCLQLSRNASAEYAYGPVSQSDSNSWLDFTLTEAPTDWDWSTGEWRLDASDIQLLNPSLEHPAATVPDMTDCQSHATLSDHSWVPSSTESLKSSRLSRDQTPDHVPVAKGRRRPDPDKRYRCNKSDCGETFTQPRSLKRHVKTVHSKVRTIFCHHVECEFARVGFNRKDSFLKHYRRRHGGDNAANDDT